MKKIKTLYPQFLVLTGLLIACAGSVHAGEQNAAESRESLYTTDNIVVLYSFDDRDRQDWMGSNHFEGVLISDEWSSSGEYSLKGILKQQSQAHWEPELTRFFHPRGKDFSHYQSISVDVRHQAGNCDPGGGLSARIYLTDAEGNWIGSGKAVPIGPETKTLTMKLPDDLSKRACASKLNNILRLSVQFLPCPSSTGNIDIYIDNITARLADG